MRKRNKILIGLSMTFGLSYATNFVVFLDDNQNNYEVMKLAGSTVIESDDWMTTSSSCSTTNDWLPEDVYKNVAYTKITSCSLDQSKTTKTYIYDENGTKVLTDENTETRTETTTETEDLVGLFEAKSCLEILNSHGNIGDGTYTLYLNNENFQNYCDMTNGGWTLAMHLKGPGQFSGAERDTFWTEGSTLSNLIVNEFFKLELTDTGFLGWNRIKEIASLNDLSMNIRGQNVLGNTVNQNYTLQDFNPNITDGNTDTGTLANGGIYSISVANDSTFNNWGTCGVNNSTEIVAHVGLGLCVEGRNNVIPVNNEVQIWHYQNYTNNINVSFGDIGETSNYTYNVTITDPYEIYMYIQ